MFKLVRAIIPDPWHALPPPVRRIGRFWSVFFLACVVWNLGAMAWGATQSSPDSQLAAMLVGVLPLTPCFIALVFATMRLRRLWRALDATAGACCAKCLYDLSALKGSGVCPECGRAFDLEQNRARWSEAGWTLAPTSPSPAASAASPPA